MLLKEAVFFLILLFSFIFPGPGESASLPKRKFELTFPGTEAAVDYAKYGRFIGVGRENYEYRILDQEGLARAAGEGVYPNTSFISDHEYQRFKAVHAGQINPWEYVDSGSARNDFYAWLDTQSEPDGIRLFYTAEALRKAGLVAEALKAYYAIVVHFPKTVQWSSDRSFYWYVAPEAIARIRKLCATFPELGIQLEGAFVEADRSGKTNPELDRVRVWPGKFVKMSSEKHERRPHRVTARRGSGRVRVVKYDDRFWALLVDGKPFMVKGVTYASTTVGESAHAINLRPWMHLDDDRNGKNDGMFDSWVDKNKNNRRDADEPAVGDARLLKEMGANAIRVYHGTDPDGNYDPKEYNKELMRTLSRDYGIFFIMGDFLGAYTVGSKAGWDEGTDYKDPAQRKRMKKVVRDMVMDHKDEPYVLMWLLGNENQHPHTRTNADEHPDVYAKFLNEVARMIHRLDRDHPVAVGNLATTNIKELARHAPEIDVYGANVYNGAYSMGSIWQLVRRYYDRPVLFTEMGCDAYAEGTGPEASGQADYFTANWEDIELNGLGNRGEGNAVGGVFFEWIDEWWKTSKGDGWGDPHEHNTQGDFRGPFPDGWMHEEWLGIFGQGDGRNSHFLREPRKVYEAIRKAWAGPRKA
jgi:beta-glucuronidase